MGRHSRSTSSSYPARLGRMVFVLTSLILTVGFLVLGSAYLAGI